MAQDDYYYEIQLTNKQLVFYFMAGATGLILSFLAGVMVGRGRRPGRGRGAGRARPCRRSAIVAEETPRPGARPPEDLTYAQRLEGRARRRSGSRSARSRARGRAAPRAAGRGHRRARRGRRRPPAPRPPPAPAAATAPPAAGRRRPARRRRRRVHHPGRRLQGPRERRVDGRRASRARASPPTSSTPAGEGLFNVRVGTFTARPDAEKRAGRLRDDEKFKPFIVKQ